MEVESQGSLPNTNRLSVLTATILLGYALAHFISLPTRPLAIQIAGIYLPFELDYQVLVSILVALLAAVGMNWLLYDHPHVQQVMEESEISTDEDLTPLRLGRFEIDRVEAQRRWLRLRLTSIHSLLPALTALVIGVPLSNLEGGLGYWIVFSMAGVLLMLVFVAEYIVVDVTDMREPPASVGLIALSFALFLILGIALRTSGMRLYLLLPLLVPVAGLLTSRTLYLKTSGDWNIPWGIGIALLIGQLAAALHYLPISPLKYGLILLGPAYALSTLAVNLQQEIEPRRIWMEPAVMLALIWLMAIVVK